MERPAAAQAVLLAAAQPVVKLAGSQAAAPAALQADAAALVAWQAGAEAAVAAETLGAAAWKNDDRRSRRTLNPRSSFYPPLSVFRRSAQSPCAKPAALTLSRERGNREPDTAKGARPLDERPNLSTFSVCYGGSMIVPATAPVTPPTAAPRSQSSSSIAQPAAAPTPAPTSVPQADTKLSEPRANVAARSVFRAFVSVLHST